MRLLVTVPGLFTNQNKLKDIRLKNQNLLVKRWSSNGIREHYNMCFKNQKIQSPPKSISFNSVKVKRRSKPN